MVLGFSRDAPSGEPPSLARFGPNPPNSCQAAETPGAPPRKKTMGRVEASLTPSFEYAVKKRCASDCPLVAFFRARKPARVVYAKASPLMVIFWWVSTGSGWLITTTEVALVS